MKVTGRGAVSVNAVLVGAMPSSGMPFGAYFQIEEKIMTHQELLTSPATLAHISDSELLLSFRQLGQASREGITVPLALVREIKAEVALREELRRFRLELANTVIQ